ncbi:MAG: UDP-N-acetylglucosamine 2-epimerase (non-hydrolyzing) [Cyanobacteria bacterium P01_F01_bin.33]
MTQLMVVAGARPNFMKVAPIMKALENRSDVFDVTFVHTGQHYDDRMSAVFLDQLGLPTPDVALGIGSGSHAEQTGKTLIALEATLIDHRPDLVIVVGDVNATLAATLAAKKLNIAVAHVEAGLRSHDLTMPEEINRVLTDRVSDIHFTTDYFADANLKREGISESSIHRVGNVMIDTLLAYRDRAARSDILDRLEVTTRSYALATLHRESNVDNPENLARLFSAFVQLSKTLPIVMPLHPRTRKRLHAIGLRGGLESSRVTLTEPLSYLDFVKLMDDSCFVLTDSGGVQEETTVLGVACLTLRKTTERPITCEIGTNTLVELDPKMILKSALPLASERVRQETALPLWDGHASERLALVLERRFDLQSLSAA